MELTRLKGLRFMLSLLLVSSLVVLLLQSCGPAAPSAVTSSTSEASTSSSNARTLSPAGGAGGIDPADARNLIDIKVSVSGNSVLGLFDLGLTGVNSVNADSFVITLANCDSGLSGTNNAGTIKVYLSDTNCLGKLTSFVLNGQSYLPSGTGSSPFTTWLAGNTAIFVGAGPNDLISVKVNSQLSSPIVATDSISYTFTFLLGATATTLIPSANSSTISTSGVQVPNFKINSGDASLISMSSGAGVFQFKLTCKSGAMTTGGGVDTAFNSYCPITAGGLYANSAPGVDIGSTYFSYKLIVDPTGNGTLTMSQAQAAFASGDSTVNLTNDILSGSTGFKTSNLTGPTTITSNPKMILILQTKNPNSPTNPANSSYQYFPITVQGFSP